MRIAPHAAPAFGLAAADTTPKTIELALGDAKPTAIGARVVDIIYDGMLNAAYLEKGVLFADLRQRPRCSWMPHD